MREDMITAVETRHKATHSDLLQGLKCSMMEVDWKGRQLLVVEKKGEVYEAITGTHRATAAMQLGIPIPVVIIEIGDLSASQTARVLNGRVQYELLADLFDSAGLSPAAELMRQEYTSGGKAPIVRPRKERTGGGRVTVRRVRT